MTVLNAEPGNTGDYTSNFPKSLQVMDLLSPVPDSTFMPDPSTECLNIFR